MNILIKLSALLALSVGWSAATATEHVIYPIEDIAISKQYSSDESLVLRADVVFPNGCYSSYGQEDKKIDETKKIRLKAEVIIRPGPCTMAVVHDQIYFDLSEYKPGNYRLIDAEDREPVARLIVDEQGNHHLKEVVY